MEPLEVRTLLAGEFTDLGALGIDGVEHSSVAWGDYDSDGDLDVLLTGSQGGVNPISKIYRNNGNNTFSDLNAGLTGVYLGAVAWGDADNDGDLDILLTGFDGADRVSKIYRNNGNSTFTATNAGLTGVYFSAVAWGDADNDGDLDILLTGNDGTNTPVAKVYRNNGNSTFTDLNAGLPGVQIGAVAWGDADNDGDLDILLTGSSLSGSIARVYRNNSDGTFSDINAGLTGVANSSVAWGDYDHDGDLDILLTGRDVNDNKVAKVYTNNGNSTFTDLNAGLTGSYLGEAAWGDFDNDGDLDILYSGANNAKVYRNNGNSTFTDVNAGLTGVSNSSIDWGDFDLDGDLDILLTGKNAVGARIAKVYRNNAVNSNTAPNAPTALTATAASATSLTLSWTAATDTQTPVPGLSYNLRIGTTPGGSNVFSTMANSTTGVRRLPDAGPIQGTSYTLSGLTPGVTYYWSVQAVDTGLLGGAFATEQTTTLSLFTDRGTAGLSGAKFSSMAWGDYDNDGDLDALVTGLQDGVGGITKVYQNDGSGTFTDINAGLTGVYAGKAVWGDYDRDGKVDILVVGLGISKVYHNVGNGSFTDINAGLAGVSIASAAWGDYDNDGDLDILLSGRATNSEIVTKLYRNDGGGTFTEQNAGLLGLYASAVTWGDYDSDGRNDILVSGLDSSNSRATKIYHNEGNGAFTDINAVLPGVSTSAVAWGDYDHDGDLDVALAGNDGTNRISKIFRNDGHNVFTDLGADLAGVSYCSLAWGDADNDGDLDLLISGTGFTGQAFTGPVTKIYRNDGANTFVDSNAGLTPMDRGLAAWGDYDGDRDLDILQVGRIGGLSSVKVYRNNSLTVNAPPSPPTGLTATISSPSSIAFSWTAAVDAQTASAGLSYNLRVGTTPGGSNVLATMASTADGTRRVASAGPIQGTSVVLKNLTPGTTYYWSVQAIDAAFVGSNFATEKSLLLGSYSNTAPTIGGAVANQPVNDTGTIAPFSAMTITDPDNQNMLAKVTILNGGVRGDFTPATTAGWTRTTAGNDIVYSRYYNPTPNIGATVQAAIRAFLFKPRTNAIQPNTTELTDFAVFINDGVANTTNTTTRVVTTSMNDAPTIDNASANVAVNDNATVNPFATLTVSDPDNQEMLARVTILNGAFRGDFTNAVTNGWTRSTVGNNISYVRYFSPGPNGGAAVQTAYRALVFQPRNNAIKPGTTELTDFLLSVSDGVATPASNQGTRVTTTSINNAPTIGGAVANQTMNDNATKAVFNTLMVTDPDTQDMLARVTIDNGVNRGDFTAASTSGWSRAVLGSDLVYTRYFSPAINIGGTVQAAIRALVFQPRNNVPVNQTEATQFIVFINDGIVNTTNSTTSVITTGVAPRPASTTRTVPPLILADDITTVVLPSLSQPRTNSFARLLKSMSK